MKKTFYFLSFILLFNACTPSKILVENDIYRQEKRTFLIQEKKAYKESNKWLSHWYPVKLTWIKIDKKPDSLKLKMELKVNHNQRISDDFYLKTDEYIFRIEPVNIIKETLNEYNDTLTETTTNEGDDEKEEKEKETTTITHSVSNKIVDSYIIELILDREIIQHLQKAKKIKIHFYLNDFGYNIDFNAYDRNRLKKFFEK